MSGWNEAKIDRLKILWAEGLSASQCAAELGGLTRNAVISKVHRLKLPPRMTTMKIKTKTKGRRKPAKARAASGGSRAVLPSDVLFRVEAQLIPVEEIVVPLDKRKGLLDLEAGDCRWPIGDPKDEAFHFCHLKAIPGLPYCQAHTARALAPPKAANRVGVAAGEDLGPAGRSGASDPQIVTSGAPTGKLEPAK